MARLFFFQRAMFLLCLLFSAIAQADTSWQKESSLYLERLLKSNPDQLPELKDSDVLEFYRERNYKLLWSNQKGRLDRAYDLLHAIIQAKGEGLEPSDYYLEEFNKYWDSPGLGESVQLDLLLSAALYHYSNEVYSGRLDVNYLDPDWHIKKGSLDISRLFADVARKSSIGNLLRELPPQHDGYQSLKRQLYQFHKLAQQGGWQSLGWGPVLKRNVQHEQVALLRRRLVVTGDLAVDSFPDKEIFDRQLEEAVRRYQQRHGLDVDGKVGPQTRKSLNITVGERIRQIRISMERRRWLPRELGKRYLMVNISGFDLYLVENGSIVLSMPVITGKSYRSTPTFSGLISSMEYNPYWTIPRNLALEDIIPHQRHDPSYLSRNSIKVYKGWENAKEIDPKSVDWNNLDENHFPYWLRQEPGPKNALGMVKFIFSNPYDVYLHGTPDRHLFDKVVRAFSSGCIRVKDPVRLAAFLLNDGSLQKEEEILANIHLEINQEVILPLAVPIYLVYWTAWVDQDGKVHFRHDMYGRDTRLKELFNS
jgi:murein L,D-transpeptidase YcbB/YkuD